MSIERKKYTLPPIADKSEREADLLARMERMEKLMANSLPSEEAENDTSE